MTETKKARNLYRIEGIIDTPMYVLATSWTEAIERWRERIRLYPPPAEDPEQDVPEPTTVTLLAHAELDYHFPELVD